MLATGTSSSLAFGRMGIEEVLVVGASGGGGRL